MLGPQPDNSNASGGMLGASSEHPATKGSCCADNQGITMNKVKLFNEIPTVQDVLQCTLATISVQGPPQFDAWIGMYGGEDFEKKCWTILPWWMQLVRPRIPIP
eukprot:scaffold4510_cov183-Amphora_coffeaeformis.AAC.39